MTREPIILTHWERIQLANHLSAYVAILDTMPRQEEARKGHSRGEQVTLVKAEAESVEKFIKLIKPKRSVQV